MCAPFKFENAAKLKKMIDEYFDTVEEDRWTVTGLALHLGCDRDTIWNYSRKDPKDSKSPVDPEVFRLMKIARLRVENGYEIDLKKSGRTGTIFALKNFGWKDESQVKNDTNLNASVKVEVQGKDTEKNLDEILEN